MRHLSEAFVPTERNLESLHLLTETFVFVLSSLAINFYHISCQLLHKRCLTVPPLCANVLENCNAMQSCSFNKCAETGGIGEGSFSRFHFFHRLLLSEKQVLTPEGRCLNTDAEALDMPSFAAVFPFTAS